jgi:hypothetical protein
MSYRLNWRAFLAFVHDVCMAAVAWVCIYWLRFNLDLREPFLSDMWSTLAWILPLQAAIFLSLGLYRGFGASQASRICSASSMRRDSARS